MQQPRLRNSLIPSNRASLGGGSIPKPPAVTFTVYADDKENAPPNKPRVSRLSIKPTLPPPVAAAPVSSNANGENTRPGYGRAMIAGPKGEEEFFTFEEIRARKHAPKPKPIVAPPTTVATAPTRSAMKSFTPEHTGNNVSFNHQPSPTMCTRAAMNEIDAMFKDGSPAFSSTSLTTEIPAMENAVCMELNQRGRPSPVAFQVFRDEDLLTGNVRSAPAAAVVPIPIQEVSATFSAKSYPPLTPILELSHESDMSHASNTSATGSRPTSAAAMQTEEDEPAAAAPTDNMVDPFDSLQREQWLEELQVLSTTPGITNLSDQAFSGDIDGLANGSETSLEIGEKLFQVTKVLCVSGSGSNRFINLQAEDLLDGGEVEIRLAPRATVLEHQFAASLVQRLLANGEQPESLKQLFYSTHESYVYSNISIAVSATSPRGNFRTLMQLYQQSPMDERLVAYYGYELLKLLHKLHSNQFLHNHLTLDSVWLRFDDSGVLSDQWQSNGSGGWSGKGLALGNFMSCIDRSLFPPETTFKCENPEYLAATNPMLAFTQESLGHPSWSNQIDLLSVANILFELLFGHKSPTGMINSCFLDENGSVQLNETFVTEFQTTTFAPFFETILNFRPSVGQQPDSLELLALLQQHFEMALDMDMNGVKASSQLKQLLYTQQQMMLMKK